MDFLTYRQAHLRLSEDFKALDESGAIINRETFLHRLSSGNYLPVRLQSGDSLASYQLYKLSSPANNEIGEIIQQWGSHLLANYKMEGKELPPYQFVDMDGNVYTKEATKGKLLVLKCWFIGCIPCVKEMPALNNLKKSYPSRNDIIFVGLAFDSRTGLDSFLKKTRFDYAVVPEQKQYILNDLGITQFPTHLIVNKAGVIAKVLDDDKELATALAKETSK